MSTFQDLTGKRIGYLEVIGVDHFVGNRRFWRCRCICGNERVFSRQALQTNQRGRSTHCGCLRIRKGINKKDLKGQRFGRWLVLEEGSSKNESVTWLCVCDCGIQKYVTGHSLRRGTSKSCGCYKSECTSKRFTKENVDVAFNRLVKRYKRTAKDRNFSWNISDDEARLIFSSNCYYCGVEPKQIMKSNARKMEYNGIDRIDNKVGYEPDNCVPCCKICNFAKRSMDQGDFIELIRKCYKNLFGDK